MSREFKPIVIGCFQSRLALSISRFMCSSVSYVYSWNFMSPLDRLQICAKGCLGCFLTILRMSNNLCIGTQLSSHSFDRRKISDAVSPDGDLPSPRSAPHLRSNRNPASPSWIGLRRRWYPEESSL